MTWHRLLFTAALVATVCSPSAHGKSPGAHQHGVAKLALAVDGNLIEITLESPLDNVLGFERAPRNDAERQAVRQMAQRFHAAAGLFVPTAAAQCTALPAELTSPVLDPALLAPANAAAAGAPAVAPKAVDGHADLDATVRFRCAQPTALKGVDTSGLFKAFPKFRQIDAAVVTGQKQSGSKLSPRQTALVW
jgi:Protein of unknown function (DUF2796)